MPISARVPPAAAVLLSLAMLLLVSATPAWAQEFAGKSVKAWNDILRDSNSVAWKPLRKQLGVGGEPAAEVLAVVIARNRGRTDEVAIRATVRACKLLSTMKGQERRAADPILSLVGIGPARTQIAAIEALPRIEFPESYPNQPLVSLKGQFEQREQDPIIRFAAARALIEVLPRSDLSEKEAGDLAETAVFHATYLKPELARVAALDVVAALGKAATPHREMLVDLLGAKSWRIRERAAAALLATEPTRDVLPPAMPHLMAILSGRRDRKDSRGPRHALALLALTPRGTGIALTVLSAKPGALDSPGGVAKVNAGGDAEPLELFDLTRRLLGSKEVGVRLAAVHALTYLKVPVGDVGPLAVRALDDVNPVVREEAIVAIVALAYQPARERLAKVAEEDRDGSLRALAEVALTKLK